MCMLRGVEIDPNRCVAWVKYESTIKGGCGGGIEVRCRLSMPQKGNVSVCVL